MNDRYGHQFTVFQLPNHAVRVRHRGRPREVSFLDWCHREIARMEGLGYRAWIVTEARPDKKYDNGMVDKIAVFTDYDWKKVHKYRRNFVLKERFE